jgi:hypothetical protein
VESGEEEGEGDGGLLKESNGSSQSRAGMESEIQAKNRMRQAKLAMKKRELQEAGHRPGT